MADYRKLKPFILRWEGGYVNDQADLGKQTNMGVTLATYRSVFGSKKTAKDLKRMTRVQWGIIFKKFYWDKWEADNIKDQNVANILVDWLWCSGSYGIKIPQRVLGVDVDGIVGQKTIAAVNARDGRELFDTIKQERKDFIERICQTRPQNRKFKNGWLNRINSLAYETD
jgi:lysozyme family protein